MAKNREKWAAGDVVSDDDLFVAQFEELLSEEYDFDCYNDEEVLKLFGDDDIATSFNNTETETVQMLVNEGHVVVPRLLGYFVETHVNVSKKIVVCNCEDYNVDGFCPHAATVEVILFDMEPPIKAVKAGENWIKIREDFKYVVKKSYVPLNHSNSSN